MIELLNCPFCGSDAEIRQDGGEHYVACTYSEECGAEGHRALVDDYAIAAWNRRTEARQARDEIVHYSFSDRLARPGVCADHGEDEVCANCRVPDPDDGCPYDWRERDLRTAWRDGYARGKVAAFAARPAEPVAVEVNPLEWTTYLDSGTWRAKKPFGSSYFIEQRDDLKYDWNGTLFDELVDAQDACQTDYEQRIHSALVSAPQVQSVVEAVQREIDAIEARLRQTAGHYPPGSDGRNTFLMEADWVASRASITETGGAK